ncbi:hypothetical protein LS72_007205 [Helicobacter apodemus]|uniref:UPF0323 domain-containing protein n=1 Tax=Helicobacter apodemus TaxID=135569 RepID=A0A4U8UD31_9HELI|nr:UPF0323 family lipoprotein [Helicobacter apodemus]MDE6958616.1 UPF0323 family lipoprotein [Helicobacter apodemus]TLE15494.1 hypothetical protein LS72_007205 [Helicobacter apodemus]
MKKYLRKISDPKVVGIFSKSGLGLAAVLIIVGCNNNIGENVGGKVKEAVKNGATVMIEQQSDGSYKILEEYPSSTTRIILKEANGNERILTQEEVDTLIAEESKKIDSGTSQLTNPTGGGLSLGETILASAAGAILGSWIGSKLFNNQNFQSQQRSSYKSPQAYERSQSSFNKGATAGTRAGTNAGKSGFYAPNNTGGQNRNNVSSGSSAGSSSFGG